MVVGVSIFVNSNTTKKPAQGFNIYVLNENVTDK